MIQDHYIEKLDDLKSISNLRILSDVNPDLIDLGSNDYLGLNSNRDLYNEFLDDLRIKKYSFSASSSRLLSGTYPQHTQLENTIAEAYEREACLLYNSGYHANIGILSCLVTKQDLIIADKFVHASLIDGFKLSDADFVRYRHLDYEHLENILLKRREQYRNVFIVSESVFSMDGDLANLSKLVELKKRYDCFLYLDEAHALGVLGNKGLGLAEVEGCIHEMDFIVGTFGKAMCSVGAFVVCSEIFKQYLVSHSRTLIFTTALPPVNIAWTQFLFKRMESLNHLRQKLQHLSTEFAQMLGEKVNSHIVPYILGENTRAIDASQKLEKAGYNVKPIRYPTVPKSTARLRFSLNANLEIDQLLDIKQILAPYGKNVVK